MADLRVPHPGLADPPTGAAPLRLRLDARTTSGASPATRSARPGARSKTLAPLVERPHRADLRRLLDARGPVRSSRPRARGDRIGYHDMLGQGPGAHGAPAPRRRLLHDPHAAGGHRATKRVAYRSRTYVHLAVGYPGLKFLPDLQEYRQNHDDFHRVVNAYEPHEHVYEDLKRRPGTVVVRGGGIVASRVLQRLMDDREDKGAQTRSSTCSAPTSPAPHGPSICHAPQGGDGWAFQGFNYAEVGAGAASSRRRCEARGRGPQAARTSSWAAPTRRIASSGRTR